MLLQIKEYLVNYWINSQITFSKKQLLVLAVLLGFLGFFFYVRITDKPDVIKEVANIREKPSLVKVMVDISGEIKKPGIYDINEGSRLYYVVEKAGGLTKNADINAVNLAQKLEDGQKIVIPGKMNLGQSSGSAVSKLVNINNASAKDIEELPGIGEVMAQRIVDKREAEGPFKKVEELNDVEGIGPKKFEQIKDLVSVF
jgi:competence protein ComEA